MDQDAFRNMLASGSGGSSSSTTNRSRGVLGGSAPKRGGWGIKAKPGHEYKPPKDDAGAAFVPRSQKKKGKETKDDSGSKYMDRAERRRLGLDDEYKPVEQLLEDLERRQKEEGVDQEEIDKQRAYLGGDATHSILVKGLDYALLARRKAELAAQGEEIADEELEALAEGAGRKSNQTIAQVSKVEEKMAKGFKSIAARDKVDEKPKKKKKKKKVNAVVEDAHSVEMKAGSKADPKPQPIKNSAEMSDPPVTSKPDPVISPPAAPIDDDEDIFGDVGAYDLTNGRPDDSDSDSEEDVAQLEHISSASRSRSRSRSRSLGQREVFDRYRPGRSPSPERYSHRQGSDRQHQDRSRHRSRSRDTYSRRDRSGSRERYEQRRSSHRDERDDHHHSRSRYDAHVGRGREPSDGYEGTRAHKHRWGRYMDDEPRSSRRSRSASHSPPPIAKRPRQATRSPSPILFDPLARMASPTPSDSDDDEHLVNGKLQPLQSSAIADVKGYLSAEAAALKAEEKKAKKAKWRARQGLALQEGTEGYLEREVGDKEKLNRDYVKVMGKLKKDEEKKEP